MDRDPLQSSTCCSSAGCTSDAPRAGDTVDLQRGEEHPHDHHDHAGHDHAHHAHHDHGDHDCAAGHASSDQGDEVGGPEVNSASARTVFDVEGLCCQSEVRLIEDALRGAPGVSELRISVPSGTLTVYHDGQSSRDEATVAALWRVGLKAHARREAGRRAAPSGSAFDGRFFTMVAGALLTALGAFLRFGVEGAAVAEKLALSAAIIIGGVYVYRQAFHALRQRRIDINILVTIAVIGAAAVGEWFEATAVILLFGFAEWLEARSMVRAREAIGALVSLAPPVARVRRGQGFEEVAVAEVRPGDEVELRPGARVPVDGVLLSGVTEIDESTITGESRHVRKVEGDALYAGTVNQAGRVSMRCTEPASRSTLARIIDAVEEARAQASPAEQFIDRFARYYTPAVVALAVAVALIGPLVAGGGGELWFYRALVFLVIACPCALVISTPIANVAGLARAARRGILVKGGKWLERLGGLRALALDKTGTLTEGKLVVEAMEVAPGVEADDLLLAAARVEAASEHPIGRAIVAAAMGRFEPGRFVDQVVDARAVVGAGIEARLRDDGGSARDENATPGAMPTLRVGQLAWLSELGVALEEDFLAKAQALEERGHTLVAVARDAQLLGVIALGDRVRAEAPAALAALRQAGIEHIAMLTGDGRPAALAVAERLGLSPDLVFARQSPHDKIAQVEALKTLSGDRVAMVGDGVNDAPALAAASVGVAMGAAGTDVALESADVALMGDDLSRLAEAIAIGKKTRAIILQNISVALGLKAIFLVLAMGGWATLWMAIVADMGASMIVIFNAMRLLRRQREPAVPPAPQVDEPALAA
ncbi:cation-translocating P-type ATPase [Lujinxingia sediminis]|uniref:Cation-translocating P-type ATPase n=1 Tax=Lujinxingia sediminis TaxID=2480984 RepID=A0ABY0CV31_9DELT|nr:cation-translocating P-type ATPase [Lujinxingia sediminis]RVU46768.1 cation-translocating P-type ATPase [Lujinxingia sediminis]